MVKHTGPLLGYNNNVPYKGHVYHVQTEDSGSRRPHVITHLFADGGRIVKTRKTSYAQFVESENLTERVRVLMRNQHKEMVLTLRKGEFDFLLEPAEGSDPRELAKHMVETRELPSDPLEDANKVVDERDFHREMEELATAPSSAPAVPRRAPPPPPPPTAAAAPSTPVPSSAEAAPIPLVQPSASTPPPEEETTYKFVGSAPPKRRSGPSPATPVPVRSSPPSRSTPPPARGRGGALPIKKRGRTDSQQSFDESELGPFGTRFVTERRFDEVVLAFFSGG